MTILQGTMQDGTVLPVQVDAQGRLVAEGLQGIQGPQGDQGPAGPAGPAGTMRDPVFLSLTLVGQTRIRKLTGVPAGTQRITLTFNGLKSGVANIVLVKLTGYVAMSSTYTATNLSFAGTAGLLRKVTDGFCIGDTPTGGTRTGIMNIVRIGANTWMENHTVAGSLPDIQTGTGMAVLSHEVESIEVFPQETSGYLNGGTIMARCDF